jgi:glycosyltransferase involved in cell wall biosynthesis
VICPLNHYQDYENPLLKDIDKFDYFLFVSTVEKRKNVGLVLDAFIKLKKDYSQAKGYKLVIAGRPGFGYENFIKKANDSGFSQDIIFSGYTSDSDCNRLYNHAKAFVFPTIYEGFGLAQIECMKCHLPIILSDIPTNREVSREYGEIFNLKNTDSLIEKMLLFVNDQYNYHQKNALADLYLEDFQWNKVAAQYMEYIENAYRN